MKSNFFAFRANYSYEEALRFQGILNSEDYCGLLAFEPLETITLGRANSEESDLLVSPEFLAQRGIQLLCTDRGGQTNYHSAGQLVGFPIGNLKALYGDPRAVRRFTEELLLGLAHACAVLGVKSVRTHSDFPGLWTNRGQLAAVGITVKDGYVFHGFTLNATQACTSGFSLIRSAIPNGAVTSLEQEGVAVGSIRELAIRVLPYLSVIQGEKVHRLSKTVSYESNYSHMVAAVSRSQMAMDHMRSNLENISFRGDVEGK